MNDISFARFDADKLDQIQLDQIQVATPCRADWNAMKGSDRARFCPTCAKNVYNLSGMNREAAQSLVRDGDGEMCVRFYKRAGGTMMTSDCSVGMRVARRPLKWMMTTIVMVLAPVLAFGGVVGGAQIRRNASSSSDGPIAALRSMQPFKLVFDWLDPTPQNVMMGAVAIMPPVAPKSKAPSGAPQNAQIADLQTADSQVGALECEPPQ